MNWNNLVNGFLQMIVLLIFLTLLLFIVYRINLWKFKITQQNFVLNEAMAIYLAGVFISLAFVLNSMFLTLNSYLGIYGINDGIIVSHLSFYVIVFKLGAISLGVYLFLYYISIFLFSKLTVEINLFQDIVSNNRRSAILLSGFLVAIFYAFSGNIDLIFSSIFTNTSNATIF